MHACQGKNLLLHSGWPDGTGRSEPYATTRRTVALPLLGRLPGGASWGRALLRRFRAVEGSGGRQNSSRRPTRPVVGSASGPLGSAARRPRRAAAKPACVGGAAEP